VELAKVAEDLGAAALLLADEGIDRDIYVVLSAVAVATRRIMLVPAITNPHSRHPVATAAALASLEELAPGRVVAGLGAGGNLVFGPMGIHPARPYTALVEAVDVIDRLLAGEIVEHHGQFSASHAVIDWSPRRLPIAIAGRGPKVELLAAQRADWMIVAGKAADEFPSLVAELRGRRGDRPGPGVIWNPLAAWRPEHVQEVRSHFAYMTVDLPRAERTALGVTDEQVAQLREIVHNEGPAAGAHLVPDALTRRFAIVGSRDEVVRRLDEGRRAARPELVAFAAHEYTAEFVRDVAEIASEAGIGPRADDHATDGERAHAGPW
jgi:5,10-methylenetetrahydromethanopterin reductase